MMVRPQIERSVRALGPGGRIISPAAMRLRLWVRRGRMYAMSILSACCLTLCLASAASASAQIVFTEIHYHPVEVPAFNADGTPVLELTNDVHEFVEIQNTGAVSVDLSGWSLAGGISFTFPTNTEVAPGAFLVVAKNPERLAAVYSLTAADVLGPYQGLLGNNADTVGLRGASGKSIDSVTYDSKFPWAQSADALGAQDRFTGLTSTNYQYKGRSLQRVSVTWPSNDPANWLASPLSGPTPGGPQAITRTIPKPVVVAFSAVQTSDGATIIRANQAVMVNCTCSATNGLSGVALEYFVDSVNSTSETHTNLNMAEMGGGRYQASIPGQIGRSIVRYRFVADRGDGLEVVSPRADDPQVAPIGIGGARETWHGYFVAPVRTSTNAAIYDVFVSTAALATMSSDITQTPKRVTAATATGLPRDIPYVATTAPQWDGTVPGVFAYNGELWDIQIRYHGSLFHRSPGTHSYKVHFPDHHPLNGQTAWFETLHGSEFMEGQKLNRLLGLPASKMRRVDWYLNSGSNEVHSEQGEYAGEMLDAWHELQQQLNPGTKREGTGELYKDVGNRDPSQNNTEGPYTRGDEAPMLTNAGWNQLQRYAWTFTLQNNHWKGPKPLRDLLAGMWTARGDSPATHNFTNNATALAKTRAWFANNWDIDSLLTSMALLEWMCIWDDACQNHFFWRRANGKWSRLGWDYDGVLGNGGGGPGGSTTQTIFGGEYGAPNVFDGVNWWKDTFYKCFRNEYKQRLWELNNSFLDPTNLTALGFTIAATFAKSRQTYVNTQLSSLGTYHRPARPTNIYPANAISLVSPTNLVTSAYSHPQSAAHYATKWELRSSSGDYEEPVLRVTSTNELIAYPVPFDQLTYGQTYYWRATHIDTNNHPSIVSTETTFTWGTSSTLAGALVINEILAHNRRTVENGGKYPDYIELRNNSGTNLILTGYTLTDDPLLPAMYAFPDGTTLIPGAYLLVWCDKDPSAPGLHAGFGLNEEGETVLLMNGSSIVDSVSFGPQAPDISIGRIVDGTGGWQANTPTPGTANSAKTLGSVSSLRINEWMADPAYGDDWFELYNPDTNVVALAGLYLSDTPSTPTLSKLPALSFIEPNGFTRFWADGSTAGGNHCNFKLEKNGESIVLTAANGATTIDTITFGAQTTDVSQGRLPDGSLNTISFSSKTASPGHCNWAPCAVFINELLADSAAPLEDAIEIYNPTGSPVDIGGWWLSDDLAERQKYQIPAGTTIPASGYRVLYAADLATGAVPFVFNAKGDEVILSAVDSAGALTGYGSLVRFGASAENVSFGRVVATGLNASSGDAEFWPLAAHTFGRDNSSSVEAFRSGAGAANAAPKIGPVTINEIMYRPPDFTATVDNSRDEFIELFNLTPQTVDLSGWRLRGDTEFVCPSSASIAPGGYLLLVSFDPADTTNLTAFRSVYNLASTTSIYGPYSEKLANSTFDVELAYPAEVGGSLDYINVDKVEYRDLAPWPVAADGSGKSLQRVSSSEIGNTASNWTGDTPTPGAVNLGIATNVAISTTSPLVGGLVGFAYAGVFAASGGTPPYSWSLTAGSVPGLVLSADGTFSGVPSVVDTNVFTVQVRDHANATTSKAFTLIVEAAAPVITTTSPLPEAVQGTPYSVALAGTAGIEPYQWVLTAGTLPAGLILNSAGILTGTPTNYGTFSFTVQLTDYAGLTTMRPFSVSVALPPLVITSISPLRDAQQAVPYSQALAAAGGLPPYAWSIGGGSLPPGLALSATGDLAGTATYPGTYNFTAGVIDSASNAAMKGLVLTVIPPALSLVTQALPDGTLGVPYSAAVEATGGAPPYTWTITWETLPDGLSLSSAGLISGIPTNAGTFSFIVRVTDSANATATQLFTIAIQNNAPTLAAQIHSGSAIQLLVYGDAGPDYTLESSTNLMDWQTSFSTNSPAMPFSWTDTSPTNSPARFYRARLGL